MEKALPGLPHPQEFGGAHLPSTGADMIRQIEGSRRQDSKTGVDSQRDVS